MKPLVLPFLFLALLTTQVFGSEPTIPELSEQLQQNGNTQEAVALLRSAFSQTTSPSVAYFAAEQWIRRSPDIASDTFSEPQKTYLCALKSNDYSKRRTIARSMLDGSHENWGMYLLAKSYFEDTRFEQHTGPDEALAEEMINDWDHFRSTQCNDDTITCIYSEILIAKQKYKEAFSLLKSAKADQKSWATPLREARFLTYANKIADAKKILNAALKEADVHARFKKNQCLHSEIVIAGILVHMQKPKKAIKLIKKLKDADTCPYAQFIMARAWLLSDDQSRAIKHLEMAVNNGYSNAERLAAYFNPETVQNNSRLGVLLMRARSNAHHKTSAAYPSTTSYSALAG